MDNNNPKNNNSNLFLVKTNTFSSTESKNNNNNTIETNINSKPLKSYHNCLCLSFEKDVYNLLN